MLACIGGSLFVALRIPEGSVCELQEATTQHRNKASTWEGSWRNNRRMSKNVPVPENNSWGLFWKANHNRDIWELCEYCTWDRQTFFYIPSLTGHRSAQ